MKDHFDDHLKAELYEDTDPSPMCRLEKIIRRLGGFKLIHDGQNNPGQFKLNPGQVSCFHRKYRLELDGVFVNTWIVFKYDKRKRWAGTEIFSKEPELLGREKMAMDIPGNEFIKEIE